jgi:hypothetical protein
VPTPVGVNSLRLSVEGRNGADYARPRVPWLMSLTIALSWEIRLEPCLGMFIPDTSVSSHKV